MTYRRMLYIFAIIKRNHFKISMVGVVGETHAHDYIEMISFHNSKEISQQQSKGIKNWKITYYVILSVLSNMTNSILGHSSPLIMHLLLCICYYIFYYALLLLYCYFSLCICYCFSHLIVLLSGT